MRFQDYNQGRRKSVGTIVSCVCLAFVMVFVVSGCKKKDTNAQNAQSGVDKVYTQGPLTVHVRVDKSKLTIAETFNMELESALASNYKVAMPAIDDKVLENFGIVDCKNPQSSLDDKGNVVTKRQYRLEPTLSGKHALPELTFEFNDVNSTAGEHHKLVTEPLDIEVTSLAGDQGSKLAIADIESVVELPRKITYKVAAVGGLFVVAVAAAIWFYLRRNRQAVLMRIFKPAHEIAYERLRALVKADLIKAGRIKEFYERISDILRHYIEHRFNLKAPERTTEEFLAEIQVVDVLAEADKKNLGEFLAHCDMVKFAKMEPTAGQIQSTLDLVQDFIEMTKSVENKIDVTDSDSLKEAQEVGSL